MRAKGQKDDFEPGWLARVLQEAEGRRGEYVRSRFYVVEITPPESYRRGDGHGGSDLAWTSGRTDIVSDYFKTEELAQQFLDRHEPDQGKRLEIREDKLYRRVVWQWY